MKTKLIHKVHITPEAVFDYEECMELGKLDKKTIKLEIEQMLYIKQDEKQDIKQYFRIKYYDEDIMIMLFVKKGNKFACMQNWMVVGVCLAEDYDEDYEDTGVNMNWYDSDFDVTAKTDWVKEIGTKEEPVLQYKITGLDKEKKYAILHK